MTDEELILMYRKYKKKRIIILFIFIFLIIFFLLFFKFPKFNNNEDTKDKVEIEEEVLEDNVPPELILTVSSIDVMQDEKIDYLLYIESAIDNNDGDLKSKVEFTEVDTSVLGEQKIIYSVSDSSSNVIQKELVVNVNKQKADKPLDNQPSKDNDNKPENNLPKPNTSNNDKNETPTNSSNKNESNLVLEEKIVKYFLFSDGYTMFNVTDACAAELKKYNKTGMCSPIQDENGIYLGMKLEIQ